MDRRQFLGMAAKGAVGAAALGVAGCQQAGVIPAGQVQQAVQENPSLPEIKWQMATSWPLALDTIFGGAQIVAERVAAMTGGKFQIDPRAAGELAPGLEVLNVVEQGAVPIGHTASYYYVGKSPITAFGTAVPFGLTARQQNAWLYEGGGLELLQAAYKDKFGVIQFPAGNTGVQMGGWFNKEIKSVADMEGLKMRIPGLGAKVMDKLGVTVQVLPGGEIFQALQTGAIDAAEWVGPYDDEKLGFAKVTKFYYYPGWWEPGPSLEIQINLGEWNKLPQEYQEVLKTASYEANMIMMARYDAKNPGALKKILEETDVQLAPFPDDVMQASEEASLQLLDEFAAQDTDFNSILKQWMSFREEIQGWHSLAELAYMDYASKRR
ncbi:MAG: twin-arginine translocation signal domain-containing protein [Caldilineae bacterium]|nr:MAG: twin-arginine translocation signal domain-containing protein [Caldilineae bacterium]